MKSSVRKMLKVIFPVMEIILEWYLLSHTEKMDLTWCDGEVEGRGWNVHIAERILEIVSAHKISSEQVRANNLVRCFTSTRGLVTGVGGSFYCVFVSMPERRHHG